MSELFEEKAGDFKRQADAVRMASAADRLAHAYLLHGDGDAEYANFAALLAATAACPNPDSDGTPCLRCSVCCQIDDGSYPEMFVLAPHSKSRKILIGKGSDDFGTMRWFLEQLHLTSIAPGRRKIGVILDADRLGAQAQNAFLKTLEEPPDKTILILASEHPSSLLPTIISRCHLISILKNRMDYNFPGLDLAAEALARLGSCATGGGLAAAMESANELLELISSLEVDAAESVSPKWDAKIARVEEFMATIPQEVKAAKREYKAMGKDLKASRDAAVASEHVKKVSVLLSFIHTWFAQLHHVALGVGSDSLPNPEIYRHFDIARLAASGVANSFVNLERAEKLVADLRWNVDRRLAITAFCCSFVEKPGTRHRG